MEKLDIIQTIKEGVNCALQNFVSLLVAIVLYILTMWIPYLNVGTTVGIVKFVIAMSRGEAVDPLILFKKENFDNLGNLFLFLGLEAMGLFAAAFFMLVPAIVLGIAWSFALYFLVDRNMRPVEALDLSFKVTNGEKWRIFATELLLVIAISILCGLLGSIPKVGAFLSLIASIFCAVVCVAVESVMFKHFSAKIPE
jgi:hypothetical protein